MFSLRTEMLLHGAMMGMFVAAAMLILLAVAMCFVAAKRRCVPYAVNIFAGNLLVSQLLTIVAMMFSQGFMYDPPFNPSYCRISMFFEDVGTYATSALFLFLIMDRMAALANGRAEWKHQTQQNVSTAIFASIFAWALSAVVSLPTFVTSDSAHRFPFSCETPLGYSAMTMSLHVWFALAAPLIVVVSYVLGACYEEERDNLWPYVARVWTFYTTCLLFFVPYYGIRIIRSFFGLPGMFPEVMDYVEVVCHMVFLFRVVILPLFVLNLSSPAPMVEMDHAFESMMKVGFCQETMLAVWKKFREVCRRNPSGDKLKLMDDFERGPVFVADLPSKS
ncbi:envelope protein UL78 [Saimiriine betaherpesvirus 4]|uniref:Envelope protein UL78 n=1 Tax=Saimiriine betaherpesvirus 4 TaxID=1535247 RepID=G8XSY3_9BETA|nr:envelope protein UL78 [Saimiriine betaherpesvirus 4]AEV80929.1 envelope protein UL78 [Saimiriine betaherpesvirus 4]